MKRALMCQPDHYQVEYVINPWMKLGSVDTKKAMAQWGEIKKTLEALHVTVEIIPQVEGLPDMVYATDQAVIRGKKAILSTFCYKERKGETTQYATWFTDHGFDIIGGDDTCFEGGEVLPYTGQFFLGTGFRSRTESARKLSKLLSSTVIPLTLCDSRFYHLDTCLFPLNDEVAFYYPPAFTPDSVRVLQTQIPTLYELTEAEALGFSANSVIVGTHILVPSGNKTFVKKLQDLGYTPIELEISEFIKSGGGIHCLILPLE